MRARLFVLAASIAAFAYACGGVDPSIVGGDGGSGDDDSGAGRRDSGTNDDASVSRDSGSGSDGGETDSGITDSGHDSGHDAGHPRGDGGIVPCGSFDDGGALTCNSGNPICCGIQYDQFTIVASDTFTCSASGGDCLAFDSGASNVVIECRDDSYCPGDKVCCGHLVSNGFTSMYETVDCQSSCPLTDDAGIVDTDYRRFCDPAGADECSATGETCGASTILPGFNVCQ